MEEESISVTGSSSQLSSPLTEDSNGTAAVPLFLVSSYQDEQQRHTNDVLPKLPSHRFRFSVWHDVSNIHVTGDKLRAPRVRDGPPSKDELFYKLRDENNKRIHHNRRGQDRKRYQREQENWEEAIHVNLSYQEMEHDYQRKMFLKVLRRLEKAQEVIIFDNGLSNLSKVSFPHCTHLNLAQNYIESFKHLPSLPCIRFLKLDQNDITTLAGLEKLRTLEFLTLRENPVAFDVGYRNKVFKILPNLKYLDHIPKLPEDLEDPPPPENNAKSCVIS